MKKLKKLTSVFLAVIMALGVLTVAPFTVSAITNHQGADWALARIGAWIDTDGYYGAQCKDFVNAYTQENWGITFPGNACDLIYANMPNGWQKIQNYDAFIPEPGDIAIWGGWGSNPYGHTAVIISANYYTFDSVDQNWVNSSSNGSAAAYVTHNYTNPKFWGVIRPPFTSPVPNVTNPWITANKNILVKGDTITFSLGADNATNYTIGIDKDGSRLITQEVGTNPSFKLDKPGEYSAYVTCYNSSNYTDSGRVYFTVLDTANLGDSFYGVILNKKCWKPIGITDNRNVEIQTEKGIARQLWKFERQADNSYKIMNTQNGECLDLENFNTENGHNIQICPDNNSTAQRWYLVPCNGGYCFVTKCGLTKVMDLEGNNTTDGTNISIYDRNNSDAQIFSVYSNDDVQLKSTKLTVSSNGKTFNWTNTYGESSYRLKIWKDKLFDGDAYYTDWNISPNTLSKYVNLPAGYYEAYIDTVNHFECKMSNVVKFTVQSNVNPTSVSLSKSSVTLGAGESATLTATVQPSNAVKTLTWSSSNTSVATVSNGKVTAKKSGTAYITVKTSNGKTAQCKVTVKPAPTSVKTNPSNITLGVGEKYTISENTNSGSYANAANLKWSTSNSGVATVAKGSANKATITARGIGTAYIKITLYNGKTAQCKVTVKPAPTSVKTNPASVTLGKGEIYTISESTNSGSYANAANLKWSTSNSSVATVTKGSANKATIKATGVGTAYIRITLYNGKTAQCKVTVKNAPSSVSLSKTSITLNKGASYTISESTNSGSYANAANLKWTSSNSSVANVTKGNGNKAVIKAKAKGTSYIKITLYNGKTAQCKVTVK